MPLTGRHRNSKEFSLSLRAPGSRYQLYLTLSWLTLLWEQVWSRGWPVFMLITLFLSASLLDILPFLPMWIHILVLLMFALIFLLLGWKTAVGITIPDKKAIRHRLERDSGLTHRPLTALADRPVYYGEEVADAMWLQHLKKAANAITSLKLNLPSPGVPKRDPFGIRAIVLLIFAVSMVTGFDEAGARINRALTPGYNDTAHFDFDIWITPPAYTGLGPVFLNRTNRDKAVTVGVSSILVAQISGEKHFWNSRPSLSLGERWHSFSETPPSSGNPATNYRIEFPIHEELAGQQTLFVDFGNGENEQWNLHVAPDEAPIVSFLSPPAVTTGTKLKISYRAEDDYGIKALSAQLRLADNAFEILGIRKEDISVQEDSIELPSTSRRQSSKGNGSTIRDFASHPWAGLPVQAWLLAEDAAGQTGKSQSLKVLLPERKFTHTVAAEIINIRRILLSTTDSAIGRAVSNLETLKQSPETFGNDISVYLSLSIAQARLIHGAKKDIPSVTRLLWATALKVEDGEFAVAEEGLNNAETDLMNALENGADKDVIERLMDRFENALATYLEALANKLAKEGMLADESAIMSQLGGDDVLSLLEQARQLMQTGAIDAARELLQGLSSMIDGLERSARSNVMNEAFEKARNTLQKLRDIRAAQQTLLDRSFKRLEGNGSTDGETNEALTERLEEARHQETLRRDLGKTMLEFEQAFGSISKSMGDAELEMRKAFNALTGNDDAGAMEAQSAALDHMREAATRATRELSRRFTRMGQGRDPFGRITGNNGSLEGGRVDLPEQGEINRSRHILKELRRRSGDHRRPRLERDYMDRLLETF